MNKYEMFLSKIVTYYIYYKYIAVFLLFVSVGYFIFAPDSNPRVELSTLSDANRSTVENQYTKELFTLVSEDNASLNMIDKLLKSGIDVNVQDAKGRTPLFYAVKAKNEEVVRHLLYKNAKIDIKDNLGVMAIDFVDKYRDSNLYQLLQDTKVFAKSKNRGYTHTTITHSTKNSMITTQVSGEKESSWSPLMRAIMNHNNEDVALFLQEGAYADSRTNNDSTPIWFAIKYKNNMALDALLEYGVDLEHHNDYNVTPLAYAIITNNIYALKQIIKKGANIHKKCNGVRTPVELAKVNRRKEIEQYLLKIGAS